MIDLPSETELRHDMIEVCRALYRQRLVAGTDGNVSARMAKGEFLVTPSGKGKGYLTVDDLVVIDVRGRFIRGTGRPTSETIIHLSALEERPDVTAVIHAHPPSATAFAMVGESIPGDLHPEMAALEGEVPLVDYAPPGSAELRDALRPYFADHSALLLGSHGVLCLGTDLWDALWRLERIEQFAQSLVTARNLGRPRLLPRGESGRLRR